MVDTTPLAKKTKAELITAYQELLARQDDIHAAATRTFAPESATLFETASAYTPDAVAKTAATLRSTITDAVDLFIQAFDDEARKFADLKKAIEVARDRLKLHHDIEAGASVLERIIAEHEARRTELEREIAEKRRDWEREREEAEYQAKVVKKRTDEEQAEARRKRESGYAEREAALAAREGELAELRKRADGFAAELAKEVEARVGALRKELAAEHTRALADKDREQEHLAKLFDLEKKVLQQELSRQTNEVALARKDAEQANKKAQDLAVRIVESSTERSAPAAPAAHGAGEGK